MTRAILADPRFRLIYRPHPRTGIMLPEHGTTDQLIRRMITATNQSDPDAGHLVDQGAFGWQLRAADVMITDVSAVAYDWLTTAKPLIVTQPEQETAVIDPLSFVADMPLVPAADAGRIVEIIRQVLTDPDQVEKMRGWCTYYYGDTTPGASMARFTAAIERMISERDAWIAQRHDVPSDLSHIGSVTH